MAAQTSSFRNIPISIYQNKLAKNIFDINIDFPYRSKEISSYEIQLLIFPYSRLIGSSDIFIYPFGELQEDLENGESNTYSKIFDMEDRVFGIILSLFIFFIFLIFNSKDIFSVQSVISILGAYAIGKEFWLDLSNFLEVKTKGSNLRLVQKNYQYQQNPLSTIFSNWKLAEKRRYGIASIHPDEFSLTKSSNSNVIKAKFDSKSLNDNKENHFGSFHLKKSLIGEFLNKGFLIGSKITINRKVGFLLISTEYFQSFDKGNYGAMENDIWKENASFLRYTFQIWRIKIYFDAKIKKNTKVLDIKLN